MGKQSEAMKCLVREQLLGFAAEWGTASSLQNGLKAG